jgi:rhodanese-related sulfurtransferase
VNIPLEALRAEADRLRGRTVVCYCNGGNRGALAADTLQQAGHPAVYSLAGGLRAAAVHLTPVRTGDHT